MSVLDKRSREEKKEKRSVSTREDLHCVSTIPYGP